MKRFKLLLLLFAIAVTIVSFAAQRAQADVFNPLSTLKGIPLPPTTWDTPGSTSPLASVQRVSTVTVHPYLPFQTSVSHMREAYSGAMGTSFAFDVGSFGIEHISNLTYVANSGVTCSHNANLLVTCTGSSISQVTIDFDYTYIANDYTGRSIWWGYTGSSNYALDYTFNLIFPAPLVYVKPKSLVPVSVTANQITWYQANTRSLPGAAQFDDPRVQVMYLPLIIR
jgi:hypothetical protein